MKILITGSSGMLAKDLIKSFGKLIDSKIHGIDLAENTNSADYEHHTADLTDLSTLEYILKVIDPDIIIHAAAMVNLNICEEDLVLATKLHIDSSRVLAAYGTRVIYISTDSVFNGKSGNYTEESVPDPINNYARTKLLGENAIRANNPNHVIIRTNIFGYNMPLKGSLCEWAIKSFKNSENIYGFDDVIFNAIYTKQLAEIILEITTSNLKGTINIASRDYVSKYEFLKYFASRFNVSEEIVGKSKSKDFNYLIERPLNTTLNVDKAKGLFSIPSIYEGIDQLYSDYITQFTDERN